MLALMERPQLLGLESVSALIACQNRQGVSPLELAVCKKYMDIAEILRRAPGTCQEVGFRVLSMQPAEEDRPEEVARFRQLGHEETILALIEKCRIPRVEGVRPVEERRVVFLEQVERLPADLLEASVLGVDLEYSLENALLPVIALVQLSTPACDYILDPACNYPRLGVLLR